MFTEVLNVHDCIRIEKGEKRNWTKCTKDKHQLDKIVSLVNYKKKKTKNLSKVQGFMVCYEYHEKRSGSPLICGRGFRWWDTLLRRNSSYLHWPHSRHCRSILLTIHVRSPCLLETECSKGSTPGLDPNAWAMFVVQSEIFGLSRPNCGRQIGRASCRERV